MTGFTSGIDEAGRGPLIGPLVICAAAIKKGDEGKLKEIGVKDSKLLTEKQREEILKSLTGLIHYELVMIQPSEIDEAVTSETTNLNWLEANHGAALLNKLDAKLDNDVVESIIDCPSTNIDAYKNYFQERVDNKDIKLIVEHKADFNYLIVGAASIIAKVAREKELEKLRKKFKLDFGSGYPADPKTKKFADENWNNSKISHLFRKSWETYRKIATRGNQKNLSEF